jgi:hypothetical protein
MQKVWQALMKYEHVIEHVITSETFAEVFVKLCWNKPLNFVTDSKLYDTGKYFAAGYPENCSVAVSKHWNQGKLFVNCSVQSSGT